VWRQDARAWMLTAQASNASNASLHSVPRACPRGRRRRRRRRRKRRRWCGRGSVLKDGLWEVAA
jgi:hypothetical protein